MFVDSLFFPAVSLSLCFLVSSSPVHFSVGILRSPSDSCFGCIYPRFAFLRHIDAPWTSLAQSIAPPTRRKDKFEAERHVHTRVHHVRMENTVVRSVESQAMGRRTARVMHMCLKWFPLLGLPLQLCHLHRLCHPPLQYPCQCHQAPSGCVMVPQAKLHLSCGLEVYPGLRRQPHRVPRAHFRHDIHLQHMCCR